MNTPKLVEKYGNLYTPKSEISDRLMREFHDDDPILSVQYADGDCDTIAWPLTNPRDLAGALYDAREMGVIPFVESVVLPDGTEFHIDSNL